MPPIKTVEEAKELVKDIRRKLGVDIPGEQTELVNNLQNSLKQ
jgi:hypothetical protein